MSPEGYCLRLSLRAGRRAPADSPATNARRFAPSGSLVGDAAGAAAERAAAKRSACPETAQSGRRRPSAAWPIWTTCWARCRRSLIAVERARYGDRLERRPPSAPSAFPPEQALGRPADFLRGGMGVGAGRRRHRAVLERAAQRSDSTTSPTPRRTASGVCSACAINADRDPARPVRLSAAGRRRHRAAAERA